MTTIGFLGPRGTFTEAALRSMPESEGAELRPYATVALALEAVRSGEVESALVAIENSIEGAVTGTLDELATGDLVIIDEAVLQVRFALLARPGAQLADLRRVGTHAVAAAQCREWIATHLGGVDIVPEASNAAAAQGVAQGHYDAAIAPAVAAEVYGLDVIATDVGDNDEAWTRFVLVARPGSLPEPTGADKTTLYLFMRANHPGALLEILTEFSVRGVDLTRIESRPTRRALGDYFFSVDCEGHISDARVGEALMGLHRVCSAVRFLGSYPRHDGKSPSLRSGVTDADFASAQGWLRDVRAGRSSSGDVDSALSD